MGLADFEKHLERGVEGFFGRVFRSGVRPVEIGRKLIREMDGTRTISARGAQLARNEYIVVLSDDDFEQLADMADVLCDELAELAQSHAREERYAFEGPVSVSIELDDHQRVGVVTIESHFRPGKAVSALVLPNGERVTLGGATLVVGRHADCDVVLSDPNASRRHCEVRPVGDGFVLADLGSTNGTKLNGSRVAEEPLHHGDVIVIGHSSLLFEQG